ncbi:MAG: glycosyltransferase [Prevotella sp.]|jgi:glycosyltransferase involved in cell wall biosynthesis|nr:glycosyltransferase [Prevotella sp.]
MPKVSVLMPVYNAERFLDKAIGSIISQTFTDWELILINDGSTDNSEAVINRFEDERIYYIKNPENQGLIKTLNKGIDYCHGRYIARMDADDISQPHRLQEQVDFLEYHPDHIMCGTNAIVIDNEDKATGKIRNLTENNLLQINLLFSPPFVHPSMMIRREILQDNRYDEAYKHVEDYELWCRIARLGKIANIGKDLLQYRWHDSNVSVLNNEIQDKLKDKVIENQIETLGLHPTNEELYYHKITFRLYQLGNKQNISTIVTDNVSAWFSKLLKQNNVKKLYNQSDFIAFLWSRWIVLCVAQKKYGKALFPTFKTLNPSVFLKLFKLVLFLRKKQ